MRAFLLIVLLEIAVAFTLLGGPSRSERVHVVRNGSRVCVYTRGRDGRIFPADAGACENLKLNERRDP